MGNFINIGKEIKAMTYRVSSLVSLSKIPLGNDDS